MLVLPPLCISGIMFLKQVCMALNMNRIEIVTGWGAVASLYGFRTKACEKS